MEKDLLVSDTLGARRMARKIEYRISVTFSSAPKNVTEILIPVFCDIFIDADGGAEFVFCRFRARQIVKNWAQNLKFQILRPVFD